MPSFVHVDWKKFELNLNFVVDKLRTEFYSVLDDFRSRTIKSNAYIFVIYMNEP